MGQCCASRMISEGEEQITLIFSDSHFVLKHYTHIKLLNNLVQYRLQQEIYKSIIKEKMFPLLLSKQHEPNAYLKLQLAFFDAVLERLEDKNNIYKVYMLLYPFINHDEETKPEETMFRYFNFITRKMTKTDLINNLKAYITFVTKDITVHLLKVEEKENVKTSLKESLQFVYTDDNIMNFINTLLGSSINNIKDNTIIEEEIYVNEFRKYNLQDYRIVRQYLMEKYSPR